MRYCYHKKDYIATGAAHGIYCDPVKREDGKCRVGGGKQLVEFEDGVRVIALRGRLLVFRGG